jgi:cytochrome c biogenesis protein CcdA
MSITAPQLGLGFVSGLLSTLSPCVLPLLPIVIGSAVAAHRWGAVAMGAGLIASFTAFGLLVASIGLSIGLDAHTLRLCAGLLMLGAGGVLIAPPLQLRLAALATGLGTHGYRLLRHFALEGWQGQLVVGLVLGAIWTPCVGPTLGAASALASQGEDLPQAAAVMLVFGLGAALPLVFIGSVSRQMLGRSRARLHRFATAGKYLLGSVLLALGLSIVSGLDRGLEIWLSLHSPEWLTELTTRY